MSDKNTIPNGGTSFDGRVAFITGAGAGIGRAALMAFVEAGANVVATDISEKSIQESARLIERQGGRALALKCDISQEADVRTALDKTIETFGRLDFAFNNGGVEQKQAAAADLEVEDWDRIINIDLRGVFLCMKYEIPCCLSKAAGLLSTLHPEPESRAKLPTPAPSTVSLA